MTKGRFLIYIIFFLTLSMHSVTTFAQTQDAVVKPSFPSCLNPQGQLRVTYTTGIHGVPGDPATYSGQDAVFYLTEETLTQCLCTINGDGIQTNWWRISSLNFDEIEILQKEGWIYIPNGAIWGLQESPYMAYNERYSCTKSDEKKKDDDHDKDDDDDNDNENRIGGLGGQILGASNFRSGQVLGLAATGDIKFVALLGTLATLSAAYAIYILKSKND